MDEFDQIAALFRPLTLGAPEALELLDDAAVIASRPGWDLVVTKDALVAGVHFLPDDPMELVARKLLRVNLSDLAAKGAEPDGWFLAVAWPEGVGIEARTRFVAGLAEDQRRFGLRLFGGDTVSTPGPLSLSATLLGWVPSGAMVKRSTARIGDALLVSGAIGDGGLGLRAAQGGLDGADVADIAALTNRYRLPEPRLELREALRAHATAAADVSDGLLADAGRIGVASGVGVRVELDRLPLSGPARRWLDRQPDRCAALSALASFGDDYEVVCTARQDRVEALMDAATNSGVTLAVIGRCEGGQGVQALCDGRPQSVLRRGWTHS